jgi:CRISPR-associated protein Cmr3
MTNTLNESLNTMTDYTTWRFGALDTWFFREARPFDTIGSPELASQFPPPAPTVAGAIKTLIGRQSGFDWQGFTPRKTADEPRHERYGLLGDLRLQGPFLCRDGEPLFPAPLFLLAKKRKPEADTAADKKPELLLSRLRIGKPVETDLGIVQLPELPDAARQTGGYKPLEDGWLTTAGLAALLNGDTPEPRAVFQADELFTHESRLGIGRDNATGVADDARLYTTRHVRPHDGVGLLVGVADLPPGIRPEPIRLGGEGRLALVDTLPDGLDLPPAPTPDGETHGLILILLTPADLDDCWRLPKAGPPVCPPRDSGQAKYWPIEVEGVRLRVCSAVLGKPRREGGWHLAERKPRRVDSFVPAGSAWYCEVEDLDLKTAIARLHLQQVGDGRQLGRGLLAVALWQRDESSRSGL